MNETDAATKEFDSTDIAANETASKGMSLAQLDSLSTMDTAEAIAKVDHLPKGKSVSPEDTANQEYPLPPDPVDSLAQMDSLSTTAKVGDETNITTTENASVLATPLPQPGLWVFVSEWGEGMAGWSTAFSELIILAQKGNATIVEPCIRQGRLVPCRKGEYNLFLSEVFNISSFRPWLGSQEEFERRAAVSHKEGMIMLPKGAKKGIKGITNFFGQTRSSNLEKAVLMGRTSASVLEISGIRRGAFQNMKLDGSALVDERKLAQTKSRLLQFKQEHKDHVRGMLEGLGVEKPYSVIHWRAERPGMGK
jgi:hypothetical protein